MKRDIRDYAKQTNIRLIAGAVAILMIVGVGLIFLIYGPNAAIFGFLCILSGFIPIGLILFVLWGMEKIVKKADRE
jgi:predicted PurR-regulated permease PerM